MVFFSGSASAETKPIGTGAKFPLLTFRDTLPQKERAYLGIEKKRTFTLHDFPCSLLILEVFSTYCTSCPRNIPILNAVYSAIENDPKLKGRIKIFGLAVGNNRKEVEGYHKEYKLLFPVLTDLLFTAHKALGAPRVPYTIFIKKSAKGMTVVHTHQSVLDSSDYVLKKIGDILQK